MARKLYEESDIQALQNAIRSKTGSTDIFSVSEMRESIERIEEFPEWVQPTGAHNTYNTGDKISYNGQHYVCTVDANVYAPGVYSWQLIN